MSVANSLANSWNSDSGSTDPQVTKPFLVLNFFKHDKSKEPEPYAKPKPLHRKQLSDGTENEDNSSHHKDLRSRHELEWGERRCGNAALGRAEVLEGKVMSDKEHQITLPAAGDAFGSLLNPSAMGSPLSVSFLQH